MERFLRSIGIYNTKHFSDLSFEMAQWDSPEKKKFFMVIRKNNPWDPALLDQFKQGLDFITYKYELRFSYVFQPKLKDVQVLFESWQFGRGYFDDFFPKNENNPVSFLAPEAGVSVGVLSC